MSAPQFGDPHPALIYKDRPAAFGVLERDGQIALVRIEKANHPPWLALPGGALDPGEDYFAAVVREFGEETGLEVLPEELLGRADQYSINVDGNAFNSRQQLFTMRCIAEAPHLKIEGDHTLTWLEPTASITRLQHPSHAWAVALHLRRGAGESAVQTR